MPILVVEKGGEKGATLHVEPGKSYVCGRDAELPLVLTDIMASRNHFEIREEDRGFILHDLGSRNGTYLNDEKVAKPTLLRIGDKIQIGETLISYLSDGKEETPQGLVGKTVGGYRILDRIGRGGMGTVYKAIQLSLNREVALKVLSARLLKDPGFVERFKYEARAAGQLNHPNLVQVYDVSTAQGIHFFSMEFMDGGSVQDVIGKEDRVGWEQALGMMIDAARGLVYAERNDIVHRDIKPDNLMLTTDGDVKIGDLGLATSKTDEEKQSEEKGSIFGTPHFISPEQAQGLEVRHSADLYSLGATFYRILTGRTPFRGEQIQDIIRQQIQDDPKPVREIASDVPQAIAAVVERLMRKDPAERYAGASALVEELEAIRLTHHPAMRGRRSRMGVLLAGLGVVVAAVVGFLVLGGNGDEPERQDQPQPVIQPQPGNGGEPDAAAIERDRQQKATIAWLELRGTAPWSDVEESNHASETWDTFLADVDSKVIQEFPDTPAAEEAVKYRDDVLAARKRIAKSIADREAAAQARTEDIRTRFSDLEKTVREHLKKEQFTDALVAHETSEHRALFRKDEPTETAYKGLREDILAAAEKYRQTTETEVEKLVGGKRDAEALAKIVAFEKAWNPTGRRERVFKGGSDWARDKKAFLQGRIRTTLIQQLDQDFKRYVPAYRRVCRLDPAGEGDNQVFAFAFGAAADELQRLLDDETGLHSWPYRDRMKRKVADLRRMERFMTRFIEAVNAGSAANLEVIIERGLTREHRILPKVTREGFKAEFRRGSVTGTVEITYAEDFTPRQFFESVLLGGNRFPLEAQDRLDLALMLAQLGLHQHIEGVLAGLGGDLPADVAADAKDVRARLVPEVAAAAEMADIRKKMGASDRDSIHLRSRVRAFEEKHARTDFFLLLGGSPPGDPGLVDRDVVTTFLENLGRR